MKPHRSLHCQDVLLVVIPDMSLLCRAEATDVANAVLDGCDAIMLGAETLRGKQPVATVDTSLHICKQAEMCFDHRHH